MSDALIALQTAAVSALANAPGLELLTGVYDGPPPRAVFPYLSVGAALVSDWSTKTEAGREIRFAVTIWDEGEEALRLQQLMGAAEAALLALPRDLPGWRIASNVFTRSLIARDPAGPWAGLVEHRVRLLAQ
jgi:hypothetical protein